MCNDGTELCGFLDAKTPGNICMTPKGKKRSLTLWKVWRKHWCSVRKLGPDLGIEIILDYGVTHGPDFLVANDKRNSVKVPSNAVICRTESKSKNYAFGIFPAKERKPLLYLCASSEMETQRWMANLRQMLKPRRHRFLEGTHSISMVDNAHSRAAGLTGLHGDLVASRLGVFVKDVHSGEIVECFEWNEMNQFHLAYTGQMDDVKKMCVIHTTKHFRAGIGELCVFCTNAQKLLQDLVTQGRGPRRRHLIERPLSLSEGDLRNAEEIKEKGTLLITGTIPNFSARSGSEAKLLNKISGSNSILDKISSFRLRASHPRAVDNVYQPEPANATLSSENISPQVENILSPRRISDISVASGIYEEILDNVVSTQDVLVESNLYEDPEELFLAAKLQPPPLPPRQRCGSESTRYGSISDDGLDSEGDTRSATPNTTDEATPPSEEKMPIGPAIEDESEYVQMSPLLTEIELHQIQHEQHKLQTEQLYVVMR